MVYHEKLVVAILVNGKPLREIKEDNDFKVRLPFGSEYAIRIKNLANKRAVVSVYVDGEDILSGNQIVIKAKETHDLQGFMKNGVVDHAFKFIEKTKEIEKYRGNKDEDGLIRVEYQFEQSMNDCSPYLPHSWSVWLPSVRDYISRGHSTGNVSCQSLDQLGEIDVSYDVNYSYDVKENTTPLRSTFQKNNDGITVKGSNKNVQYNCTYVGALGPKNTIILQLCGEINENEQVIEKPLYAQEKITCETCGRKNSTKHKFCPNCGTNLY